MKLFTALMESKTRTFTNNTIRVWYELLKNYNELDLEIAFTELIKKTEPFPQVAHIIELIDKQDNINDEAEKMFDMILRKIRDHGIECYKHMKPEVSDILKGITTYYEIARGNDYTVSKIKKTFINNYKNVLISDKKKSLGIDDNIKKLLESKND